MVHKYYAREWLQRLWLYIPYRSRCQEDVSTTCLYPFLRRGSRRVGAGGSGVDSDRWPWTYGP